MRKNKLFKHLKAAVDSTGKRPILECLHFEKDGSYVVTDSHVLLRMEHQHHLEQDFNLNLLTFEEDQFDYPETHRLIPSESTGSLKLTTDLLDTLVTVLKGQTEPVKIELNDGDATLLGQGVRLPMGEWRSPSMSPVTLNPKLLLKAVSFFDDYITAQSQTVTLSIISDLRPIVFKSGNATYLVTPIRTF